MSESIVEISSLKFSWNPKESPLLDISELQIKTGEKVFLCGPSGSGKSTFLNLIGGVLKPTSGRLNLFGENISDLASVKKDRIRGDYLGFIFQMFNLIPYLSVIENVLLPCRFSEIKRKNILDSGENLENEAERLLTHLNLDFGAIKNRPVTELSVGQQQRVATARALIGKPKIIIADEPTSALDAETRDAFVSLLFEECEKSGATVIFVSHDPSIGKNFARTIHLKDLRPR